MLISLEKIKDHWTFLVKKSHAGKILQEFKLSKEILLRITIDQIVNLNGGKGFFMQLTTNQGPFMLRLTKVPVVPKVEEEIEDVIEEVVAPLQENEIKPKDTVESNMKDVEHMVLDSIESESLTTPPDHK